MDSLCYAKYVSLHNASHEVLFLHQLLDGLHIFQDDPTHVYYNNNAARQLSKDQC